MQGARQGKYITRGSDCPPGLGVAANVAAPLLNNAFMLMEKESDPRLRFPRACCSFHIIIPRVERIARRGEGVSERQTEREKER